MSRSHNGTKDDDSGQRDGASGTPESIELLPPETATYKGVTYVVATERILRAVFSQTRGDRAMECE